ncbi:MAG: hypothetical protein H0T62_08070 [Parachlamydiaceae bacterium]|nr:hypothetical protein [Parachlamydiaceae bacterium]
MLINIPVSKNFESTNFQDLADNIEIGSGNVVNTDYKVIAKPTWGDYIKNFFLSLCFCSQNLDYNAERIFNIITSDIQKSLSNYIMEMAENPGVDSEVVRKELLSTRAELEVLNSVDHQEGLIIEPFKRDERIAELQAKETSFVEQLKQAPINHKEKYIQKTQEICDKVEPLILAIIKRQSLNKLDQKWNYFTKSIKIENRFENNTKVIHDIYYQKMDLTKSLTDPIGHRLNVWSGMKSIFSGNLADKKVEYLESVVDI